MLAAPDDDDDDDVSKPIRYFLWFISKDTFSIFITDFVICNC